MDKHLLTLENINKFKELYLALPHMVLNQSVNELKMALEEFSKCGGDLNFDDGILLQYAARSGNLEIFEALLEKGARIDIDEECLLTEVADRGHMEALKFLFSKGAKTDFFETSRDYKSNKKVQKCVNTFLQEKAHLEDLKKHNDPLTASTSSSSSTQDKVLFS